MIELNSNDPFGLFRQWMADAEKSEPEDPNAMALATADASGVPSVRMVLLKGIDERGFVFYTISKAARERNLLKTLTPPCAFTGNP